MDDVGAFDKTDQTVAVQGGLPSSPRATTERLATR